MKYLRVQTTNVQITKKLQYVICGVSNFIAALPVFNHVSLLPRDLNVTEGDSVSFHCGTYAEPDAQVVWLQNGKELNRK